MSGNPWHSLPYTPPFILPDDKKKVEAFNATAREHALNLGIIPAPFSGRLDAPVVLLGNIAGAGDDHPEDYKLNPTHAARMRSNLVHAPSMFPFYPFDPGPDIYPTHKEWWAYRLRWLLASFGNGSAAESILARSILGVEFFPYRSRSNRYAHDRLSLPSQEYSRILVQNAMDNGAVIVVRYGKNRWFRAMPGLAKYKHLLLLEGRQQTYISPNGFVDPDGYDKVVDKIKASLTLAGGKGGS